MGSGLLVCIRCRQRTGRKLQSCSRSPASYSTGWASLPTPTADLRIQAHTKFPSQLDWSCGVAVQGGERQDSSTCLLKTKNNIYGGHVPSYTSSAPLSACEAVETRVFYQQRLRGVTACLQFNARLLPTPLLHATTCDSRRRCVCVREM